MTMMRKLIIALSAAFLACAPAHAQTGSVKTPAALATETNALWPDNCAGCITPFNSRQTLLDIISSYGGVVPSGATATTQTCSDNTTLVSTDAFVQCAISLASTHFAAGGTTTGTANAQVVAATSPPVFSLTGNPTVTFIAGFSNTGATTLNVVSTGAKNVLKKTNGGLVALAAGDIISGQQYLATYDGTQYELQEPSQTTNVPVQAPGLAFVGATLNAAASRIYNITLAPYSAPCNYNAVTDGAMGSGSSTLTSATAAFTSSDVGKYIAVGGAAAAGANLFTTIATFTNSTTVTLTSGNASGGAISGKTVEYGNDDTAAIQAAFNAAAVGGGTVYIPGGKRCLLSRLNATGVSISVEIRGDGVNASALFPLQVASYGTANGHMIDLTGSAFIRLKDFQIGGFYELAAPTTAINMAQIASGVSNRFLFDGIYVSGQFTLSTVYNYGVPSSEARHSDFYNYKAGAGSQDVMRFSATNAGSVTSSFATVTSGAQSTSDWLFTDDEFHKFAGAGANNDVITLDGVTNINFVGGVVSGGASEYVQFANTWSNVNFLGVTFETESQPVTPNNAYFLAAASVGTGISEMQSSYILGSTVYGGTGTVLQKNVKTQAMAVGSLPTCNAAAEGTTYGVTDANGTTFNATVAAGGANHVMVYCNATNWVIGG